MSGGEPDCLVFCGNGTLPVPQFPPQEDGLVTGSTFYVAVRMT